MIKMDVLGDDGNPVLGKERVSPETRACDVTNIESSFDHVINTILRPIINNRTSNLLLRSASV